MPLRPLWFDDIGKAPERMLKFDLETRKPLEEPDSNATLILSAGVAYCMCMRISPTCHVP
jgi:hypothetical protein